MLIFRKILFLLLISLNGVLLFGQKVEQGHYADSIFSISEKVVHPEIPCLRDSSYTCTIDIYSQSSFDSIQSKLYELLLQNEHNIRVLIHKGTYYYANNHLRLGHWNFPESSISITGEDGTILIGKGTIHPNAGNIAFSDLSYKHAFLDPDYKERYLWSDLRQTSDSIEVINKDKGICRIKLASQDYELEKSQAISPHIQITEWYYSRCYPVIGIKEGWLYFRAIGNSLDWNPHSKTLRVNSDWGFGQKMPRYRLLNCNVIGNEFYETEASTWLRITDCNFRSFEILGLLFIGNGDGSSLFCFQGLTTDNIHICNCGFSYLHSGIALVDRTDNFVFQGNEVKNCYNYGIICRCSSANAVIQNNRFDNLGFGLGNYYAIKCEGSNFLIRNNKISNFCYGGIGVGLNAHDLHTNYVSGIVEENELWQDIEVYSHPELYTLMDGGAIYSWPNVDNIIIRKNYIHNINGWCRNRGIFLDDGASNLTVYGNVISSVANSYSIDFRYSDAFANVLPMHNTNNSIFFNVLDGAYLFQGRKDIEDHCYSSQNILANSEDGNFGIIVNNIIKRGKDIEVYAPFSDTDNLRRIMQNYLPSSIWLSFEKIINHE